MSVFATRRTMMVDTQIRPSDVTKFPIIDAMLEVPREAFVPPAAREAAYMGENISLGGPRVVLEPRTLAKILDALDIQPDELVLDIGCGLGYSSAVMARLAEAVVALEDDADMAKEAEATLADHGADNVAVVNGTLSEGAAQHGPYDVMVIQGAVVQFPQGLADQIKDGGRVAAIFMDGALGSVKIGYKLDGEISWRFSFNAGAPVLQGFEAQHSFTL